MIVPLLLVTALATQLPEQTPSTVAPPAAPQSVEAAAPAPAAVEAASDLPAPSPPAPTSTAPPPAPPPPAPAPPVPQRTTSSSEERGIGLAVLNLQTSGEIPKDLSSALSGLVAARLDRAGVFRIVSEDDVKRMVDFDQMKTALTCDDQASCLADIGAALGVPFMLTGTVAKLGSSYTLALTLVEIDKARVEKRTSAVFTDVDKLLAGLDTEVERAVQSLLYKEQGSLLVVATEEGATIAVDGNALGTSPLPATSVASGPHRITINKDGFIQFALDVLVRPKETTTVDAVLRPSPEFLAAYKARSGGQRTAAWGTSVGGVATTLVGGAGVGWFFFRREGLRSEKGVGPAEDIGVNGAEYAELAGAFWGGIGAAVVGVGLVATSAVLFSTGEDPDRYDALAVPGSVGVAR